MLPFFLSGKSCQVIWTIVPSLLPSLLLQSDCPDFEGSAQLGIGMSYSTDFAVFNIVKGGGGQTHVKKYMVEVYIWICDFRLLEIKLSCNTDFAGILT